MTLRVSSSGRVWLVFSQWDAVAVWWLQSDAGGANSFQALLGWTSKVPHSHLIAALDADCRVLSYTVNQDTRCWSLEHGLGFPTAWRSKESWTPYIAAHRSKQKCFSNEGENHLGIQTVPLLLHCIAYSGVCKSNPDSKKGGVATSWQENCKRFVDLF